MPDSMGCHRRQRVCRGTPARPLRPQRRAGQGWSASAGRSWRGGEWYTGAGPGCEGGSPPPPPTATTSKTCLAVGGQDRDVWNPDAWHASFPGEKKITAVEKSHTQSLSAASNFWFKDKRWVRGAEGVPSNPHRPKRRRQTNCFPPRQDSIHGLTSKIKKPNSFNTTVGSTGENLPYLKYPFFFSPEIAFPANLCHYLHPEYSPPPQINPPPRNKTPWGAMIWRL